MTASGSRTWLSVRAVTAVGVGLFLLATGAAPRAEESSAPQFVLLDVEGRPLVDVRVTVQGRTGAVRTAEDGSFHLAYTPPPPPFRLVHRLPG